MDREICRMLAERREFPVLDVIEALKAFSQPELLDTTTEQVSLESLEEGSPETSTVVAPLSRTVKAGKK
jgi:hypothetical protein